MYFKLDILNISFESDPWIIVIPVLCIFEVCNIKLVPGVSVTAIPKE